MAALLFGTAVVAAILIVRVARTDQAHPDYRSRGYMAGLALVVLAGEVLEILRERTLYSTPAYWVCSALLLPAGLGGVVMTIRLVRAFRAAARTR
ncbi:MAG TPA: hypothetical protein VGS41_19085 [Chthonomonadales bacterium]|nr:hypothetical protein [Chthonomonadales bacterium]